MTPFWTPERVDRARAIVAKHARLRDALEEISAEFGRPVSSAALRGARGRVANDVDIPITWDDDEPPTDPAVPHPQHDARVADDALETVLLVPDTHRPFHDQRAWAVMLAAARRLRPTRIVVLGDFCDFWSVSSHAKDPSRSLQLVDEVADVNAGLDELDALGATHKHFIEGNHEFRLARYLQDHAPALVGSTSVPELLHLKERGWTFTPYRQHLQVGKLHLTHDVGQAGAYAHVRAGAAFESSVAIGHTHRLGVSYFGAATGESHVAAMMGWLGDRDAADYMHRIRAMKDWHLGFGVVRVEPTGVSHLQAIPIINYRAVIDGVLVEAHDHGS